MKEDLKGYSLVPSYGHSEHPILNWRRIL